VTATRLRPRRSGIIGAPRLCGRRYRHAPVFGICQVAPRGRARLWVCGQDHQRRPEDHRRMIERRAPKIASDRRVAAGMTFINLDRNQDDCISEQLLAHLHVATEESVITLVAAFRAHDRARLAYLCYRKTHMRGIVPAIGSTCSLVDLVEEPGPGQGRAIFDQSRDHTKEAKRAAGRVRPVITLASSVGRSFSAPIESDEISAQAVAS
jgi:hypothetical protein